MKKTFALVLALAGAYGVVRVAGQAPAAGPFTTAQADAGRTAYQANCASCHNPDLSGSGNAAPLAGSLFMGSWGNRTTKDLVDFMSGAMPPNNPGGLTDVTYVNIAAFILQTNGSRAGSQALATTTNTRIGSVATGQLVAQAGGGGGRGQGKQAAGGAGGARGGRGAAAPAPRGLTIAGTVKNFTPITDAMMKNPDPNDWLILRHDYHANNYSTLNQITASNVKDLQLQWVWSMADGTNQAAPVVHDGTIFINNPTNIVQALDAKTGELDLGKPIGRERDRQFAARPGDLRRQGVRHHRRRTHLRAGRAHRQERLGHGDRGSHQWELQHIERSAAGQGHGDSRPGRWAVRPVSRREMLHQRV